MQLRLISSALLALALLGCGSSSSVKEDDDDFAVNAGFNNLNSEQEGKLFQTNDVFANRVGQFAFSFVATDGDWSILISIQSTKAELLATGTYTIEANNTTGIVASASLTYNPSELNNYHDGPVVLNAEEGGGAILLKSFDDDGARGSFKFTAISKSLIVYHQFVEGNFDIIF